MDDEDSKIRRNVVWASSVILILGWLEVPLDVLASRLLGVQSSGVYSIDGGRIWAAAIFLLSYLGLRFLLSEPYAAAKLAAKGELASRRQSFLKAWIAFELWYYVRLGITPWILGKDFTVSHPRNHREGDALWRARLPSVSLVGIDGKSYEPLWPAKCEVALWRTTRKGSTFTDHGEGPPVTVYHSAPLSNFQQFAGESFVHLSILAYSKFTIAVVVPMALGISAFTVCAVQLWRVYRPVL